MTLEFQTEDEDEYDAVKAFFRYAQIRYGVMINKDAGKPKPWTCDPTLQEYRFCNVFREDDKVTKWFRENIRDPLRNDPRVLLATFVFRLFNFVETGENMLLFGPVDPFVLFSTEGWGEHKETFRARVKDQKQKVTGAYMTKTPTGLDKVDGCIQVVDWFIEHCHGDVEKQALEIERNGSSLQYLTEWIDESPFMGPFLSYEVVTDLRHTCLGRNALDILTWANPGPGAARGLSRLCGVHHDTLKREKKQDVVVMIELMQELLAASDEPHLWPFDFPDMEMREIEHTLCEFDKYERVRSGQGRPRSRYNGSI